MDAIRMQAVGKVDRNGDPYYFTCPTMPCSVDLSKVVLLIYPWMREGKSGADIVIKPHTKGEDKSDDNAT